MRVYILSGYLMTFIMNRNYGYTVRGIKTYVLNRFLRIFPPYWFVCAITLFCLIFAPAYFADMHPSLRFPKTTHEILSNLFIFGLSFEVPMARLSPPAWALHVELCFYVLIGLFLGRYKLLVTLWLALSVGYHIVALIYDMPRYAPVSAASLPFSLGAFLYHNKDRIAGLIPASARITVASLSLFCVFALTAELIPVKTNVIPFYINIAFSFILIHQLSTIDRKAFPSLKKIDAFLGDLSYPIYLSHWLIAAGLSAVFHLQKSLLLFAILIPCVLLFSIIMKVVVDDPIERKRRAIAASLQDTARGAG
ncbi:MAG: hypothetical protein CMJ49_03450 [Planctomycetaceae bacterium]|nr:hypothetical protein [Planctomycetaceae bacterium]